MADNTNALAEALVYHKMKGKEGGGRREGGEERESRYMEKRERRGEMKTM